MGSLIIWKHVPPFFLQYYVRDSEKITKSDQEIFYNYAKRIGTLILGPPGSNYGAKKMISPQAFLRLAQLQDVNYLHCTTSKFVHLTGHIWTIWIFFARLLSNLSKSTRCPPMSATVLPSSRSWIIPQKCRKALKALFLVRSSLTFQKSCWIHAAGLENSSVWNFVTCRFRQLLTRS